jgi:hypothetical protein
MLLEINVPIQGNLHDCKGMAIELRHLEFCLAWMSDCTVADLLSIQS